MSDPSIYTELDDCLFQIYEAPVWDGDLISKAARDEFVARDWVSQCHGWNVITSTGRGVVEGLRIRRVKSPHGEKQ